MRQGAAEHTAALCTAQNLEQRVELQLDPDFIIVVGLYAEFAKEGVLYDQLYMISSMHVNTAEIALHGQLPAGTQQGGMGEGKRHRRRTDLFDLPASSAP